LSERRFARPTSLHLRAIDRINPVDDHFDIRLEVPISLAFDPNASQSASSETKLDFGHRYPVDVSKENFAR
jgi:hypothetical protein